MKPSGHGFGRWGGGIVWLLLLGVCPLGCGSKPPPGPPPRPLVRVRLMDSVQQVKLTAASPPTVQTPGSSPQKLGLPVNQPLAVTLSPAGWHVGGLTFAPGELTIGPDPEGSVTLDGLAYRGTYHLVPTSTSTFDVVNHVDIDAYLKGVLGRELFPEFEPGAYKAQAIVARTYALYVARTAPPGRSWDLHADTKSQVYGGIKAETPKSVEATTATEGVALVYGPAGQEKIFKAYFSSCCGGATQSAADAFGEPAFQPLSAQSIGPRCNVSAGKYHARFNWGPITVGKEELGRRFRTFGKSHNRPEKDITTVQRIDVFRANAAGRPVQFIVTDARNVSYLLSGEDLRLAVNTSATTDTTLPSSFVTPETGSIVVRFTHGHGFGHGVGLCQWCAQAEAVQGIPHEKIVLDAYPGARLMRVY